MTRLIALLSLAALAACGVDGAPIRPEVNTTISVGTEGISTSTGVSVRKGPVTVGVKL